jgi:hypothetical protein
MKKFEIFDVNAPFFDANTIIEANTPIEAARKYLKSKERYKGFDIKRSASDNVPISSREIVFRDGVMYRLHRPTQWYELV